jgi:hypothetical protein
MHPYATKQYRQPADPGNKTDDTDLSARSTALARSSSESSNSVHLAKAESD